MDINFIKIADVQEAGKQTRMVQIKCNNCSSKRHIVQNSLGRIKDYIKSSLPLNSCPSCGAVTEIDSKDLPVIKNILGCQNV